MLLKYTMETLPIDVLKLISVNINDRDFINLIMTTHNAYNLKNIKYLTNQYKLSSIINSHNNYIFTNIFYDFLEWNPNMITRSIEKITFIDEFNENFSELFNFKNIKYINIGIFYINESLLDNGINIVNKNELIMTFITNKLFNQELKEDIDKLKDITSNGKFPILYNKASSYAIFRKQLKKCSVDTSIGITQINKRWTDKFNNHIRLSNKYEFPFYFNDNESLTHKHLDFYNFLVQKMLTNIKILQNKIFEKYNCKNLDDLLILMWGKERFNKSKTDNLKRKEEREQRKIEREQRKNSMIQKIKEKGKYIEETEEYIIEDENSVEIYKFN